MSMFEAIDISGSGVDAMQQWINADAGNIANANDAVSPGEPTYAEQIANFSPQSADNAGVGTGVSVNFSSGPRMGEPEASSSPLAKNGVVLYPDVSISDQLTQLMQAQDAYEGNTSAMARAMTSYQAGLEIGT